jgi:hypothetical protein
MSARETMAVDVVDKQARTLIALEKMPKEAVELNPKTKPVMKEQT